MVFYVCPRCGYNTKRRCDMKTHINRKKICKSKLSTLIPKEIENDILIGHKTNPLVENQVDELKEEIEKLKNQIMESNSKNLTINNNHNTTNNNNITIVLKPAYDPEFEFLTDKDYKQCLNRMIMSVPNLIRKIHFNPKHPENHNLYIPNIQQKYAMLYNEKEWQLKNTNDTIDKLLRNHEMMLEEWIDCGGDEFPQAMKNFKTYLEKREENGVEDTIKEEIKLLLYNKRKMIKNLKIQPMF